MKRQDKEGETILTSAGMEDMDPDSLVEPTIPEMPDEQAEEQKPLEQEEEEEEEALAPKVKVTMVPSNASNESAHEFTASLLRFKLEPNKESDHISSLKKIVRMNIKMGIEEAMTLLNVYTLADRSIEYSFEFSYVYAE